jgi:hypothetical protein
MTLNHQACPLRETGIEGLTELHGRRGGGGIIAASCAFGAEIALERRAWTKFPPIL